MKIYNERYSDFESMMERYKNEMQKLFDKQEGEKGTGTPAANAEDTVFAAPQETPAEEKMNSAELPAADRSARGLDIVESPAPENDKGYIIVSVNSGRDAFPIAGASVVIDRSDENDPGGRQQIVAVLHTDKSGRTPAQEVDTVSRELSLEPGMTGPFVTYYVSVKCEGYDPVESRPVDVFGGETSLLELELVPKTEDLTGGLG